MSATWFRCVGHLMMMGIIVQLCKVNDVDEVVYTYTSPICAVLLKEPSCGPFVSSNPAAECYRDACV